MPKHLLSTIIILTYCYTIGYTQNIDTIFYKNGNKLVDSFTLSTKNNFLIFKKNNEQSITPADILRVKLKNKEYIPVTVFLIEGESTIYFAKRLDNAEISILELLTTDKKGEVIKKYFFWKDGKATMINEQQLNVFYKMYLKNCYSPTENKHLAYNYDNISLVLKKYFLLCHVFLHYHRCALVLYTKHQQGEYFRKAAGIFQNVKESCLSLF